MTVIENLQKEFRALSKDISALSRFVVVILVFAVARLIYLIFIQRYEDAAVLFSVVAILISVLTITKVSTRAITHSEIVRHYEEHKDVAHRTNYLIRIVTELDGRADYCLRSVQANDPIESFVRNVRKMEDGYEKISCQTYSDIHNQIVNSCLTSMNSTIHWLSVYSDQLSLDITIQTEDLRSFLKEDFDALNSRVSELRRHLSTLDDQLRKIREQVELYSRA
ncbi:hypothetical protein [Marinobacter sp. AN1]|uniref:hypothetical protein n=1 Tax=Marinobacter sp. AN1 TaxID=2886046 RepID=UPI0022303F15|nr:hypothetical protein [Marinobacter sp. AN1]UZD64226.1 hypothetical protein LJ360_11295 [Marinobacter sp. AN1]